MPWARPSRTASPRAVPAAAASTASSRTTSGHGIGTSMHMDPQVPNYRVSGKGPKVVDGTTICIEPMVALGDQDNIVLDDEWTVATRDRVPRGALGALGGGDRAGAVRAHRDRRRCGAAALPGGGLRPDRPRLTPATGPLSVRPGTLAARSTAGVPDVAVRRVRPGTRVDVQARDGPAPTPCTAIDGPSRGPGAHGRPRRHRRREPSEREHDDGPVGRPDHRPHPEQTPGPAPALAAGFPEQGREEWQRLVAAVLNKGRAEDARLDGRAGRGGAAPPPRGRARGRRPLPARRPRPRRARRDAVHPRPGPARRDHPVGRAPAARRPGRRRDPRRRARRPRARRHLGVGARRRRRHRRGRPARGARRRAPRPRPGRASRRSPTSRPRPGPCSTTWPTASRSAATSGSTRSARRPGSAPPPTSRPSPTWCASAPTSTAGAPSPSTPGCSTRPAPPTSTPSPWPSPPGSRTCATSRRPASPQPRRSGRSTCGSGRPPTSSSPRPPCAPCAGCGPGSARPAASPRTSAACAPTPSRACGCSPARTRGSTCCAAPWPRSGPRSAAPTPSPCCPTTRCWACPSGSAGGWPATPRSCSPTSRTSAGSPTPAAARGTSSRSPTRWRMPCGPASRRSSGPAVPCRPSPTGCCTAGSSRRAPSATGRSSPASARSPGCRCSPSRATSPPRAGRDTVVAGGSSGAGTPARLDRVRAAA